MPFQSVAAGMRRVIGLSPLGTSARPEQMQIVLPDLRATDSAFAVELRDGRIALPSGHLNLNRAAPFDIAIEDDAVAREFLSLDWLRHLNASRSAEGEDQSRHFLIAWGRSRARRGVIASDPAVAARRSLALLAHVDAGLSGANARDFDAIMDMVGDEFATLAQATLRMPLAMPRLTALIALNAYSICVGQDGPADRSKIERRLSSELDRQVLPDGGHISRSPAALLDLVLDLVPLQRVYLSAHLEPPKALTSALQRLRLMIELLTHADRQLGRFNGMGATSLTDIFMVLKSLAPPAIATRSAVAPDTGYIRIVEGETVLLFDSGPGSETLAGEAPFAGALSFELSAASCLLVVNAGSDHRVFGQRRLEARATAAHSALVVAQASSAPATGARGGVTKAELVTDQGDVAPATIRSSTDGYRQRFGYAHHRTLGVLRDGWLIDGSDRLEATATAGKQDFAVHFHLHPSVHVETEPEAELIRLTTADGSRWSFSANGARVHIEPSVFYAAPGGAKPTLQIVLRGEATGSREVTWRFERMSPSAVS